MIPEGMYSIIANVFLLCVFSWIIFTIVGNAAFLGLAASDIWNIQRYSKAKKILLISGLAFFPEIGVLAWAMYFGRTRKFILRIIAFAASSLYLLLQIGFVWLPFQDVGLIQADGLGTSLAFGLLAHLMWLPFIFGGGVITFFILRARILKSSSSPVTPVIQQEPH